jgi:hypothetical protein
MNGFVIPGSVVDRVMFKTDAALRASIDELEVVKGFPSRRCLHLPLTVLLQRPKGALGLTIGIDDLFPGGKVGAEERERAEETQQTRPEQKIAIHGGGSGVEGAG